MGEIADMHSQGLTVNQIADSLMMDRREVKTVLDKEAARAGALSRSMNYPSYDTIHRELQKMKERVIKLEAKLKEAGIKIDF
jgi:hypothetical protein